ncbi:hypothetical protein [Micromonospora sp. DT47]|uniref:hypothetical protein n=1 Tax=Micromonospora sp. DT47 TaxID=3393431 RepID=UPI003CF790DA
MPGRLAAWRARARLGEVTAAIARGRPWQADEFGRAVTGRQGSKLMALRAPPGMKATACH